jgi:hypothetical protein
MKASQWHRKASQRQLDMPNWREDNGKKITNTKNQRPLLRPQTSQPRIEPPDGYRTAS